MSGPGKRTPRTSELAQNGVSPARVPRRSNLSNAQPSTPLPPLQEGSERVKVVVRVRPSTLAETPGGVKIAADSQTIIVHRKHEGAMQTNFTFDQVLGPVATQEDVYNAAVKPIVEDVMKGYNGTIMAYGQTGAGKTHTLSSVSSADNIGMMPRAAASIFQDIARDSAHTYNVMMAYVQIYMELVQDLLKPENGNLQIREGSNGVYVAGAEEHPVRSMRDCLHLMQLGEQNRKTAFTQLNAHSSRSHAIIMLTVVKRQRTASSTVVPDKEKMKVGKLFIVDLAGSERLKKSLSTGQRASEAKAINLSLTTLGIVINARADHTSKHIPYRDSKLTRLLQESLGGNTKTSLVIAIADSVEHADETLQSLQFGSRAIHVKTSAVINESLGSNLLNADLLAKLSSIELLPCVTDASLLAKDEEIRKIQDMLEGERERANKALEELRAEKAVEQRLQEQELSAAQAQLNSREQEVRRHEAELSQVKSTLAETEGQLRTNIDTIKGKLRAAETDCQVLEARLAEEQESAADAAKALELQLSEKAAAVSDLRKEKAELLTQLSSLQARVQEQAESIDNAADERTTFTQTIKELRKELAERCRAADALSEEKSKLARDTAQEIYELKDRVEALGLQKAQLGRSMKDETQQLKAQQAQEMAAALQQLKDSQQAAAAQLESQANSIASKTRQECQAETDLQISKLKELHVAACQQADEEMQRLRAELEHERARNAETNQSLEQQLLAADDKYNHLLAQSAGETRNFEELSHQMRADLEERKQEVAELQAAICQAHEQAAEAHHKAAAAHDHTTEAVQAVHEQHAAHLRETQATHEEEKAALEKRHQDSLLAVETQLSSQAARAQQAGAQHQSDMAALHKRYQGKKEQWLANVEQLETKWNETLQRSKVDAAQKLDAEKEAFAKQLASKERELDSISADKAHLQEKLSIVEGLHAALRDDHSNVVSQNQTLRERVQRYEKKLGVSQQKLQKAEGQVRVLEERQVQLRDLWLSNKRQNRAALIIQKHYRAWHLRRVRHQNNKNAQDLALVRKHKYNLEGQNANLQQSHHKQLVVAGEGMFASSVKMLDDALWSIRVAFLMPSKDLKNYQNLKGRSSSSPYGGLTSRLQYNASPLSRNLSFISNASDQTDASDGPLGSGQLIAAHHGPASSKHTPLGSRLHARTTR